MSRELENENFQDLERLRRILFSWPMRLKCLLERDTSDAYQEMINTADYLKTDPHRAISELSRGMKRVVELLSQRVGRRVPPLTFTRAAIFLCDMLREECHWVLERRPAGEGLTECDIICSEMGCGSLGSISLSELERDKVWRCSDHGEEGRTPAIERDAGDVPANNSAGVGRAHHSSHSGGYLTINHKLLRVLAFVFATALVGSAIVWHRSSLSRPSEFCQATDLMVRTLSLERDSGDTLDDAIHNLPAGDPDARQFAIQLANVVFKNPNFDESTLRNGAQIACRKWDAQRVPKQLR